MGKNLSIVDEDSMNGAGAYDTGFRWRMRRPRIGGVDLKCLEIKNFKDT